MEPYCSRNEVIFENFDTVPYAYIPEVLEATLGDIEVSEGRLRPLKKTKWAETGIGTRREYVSPEEASLNELTFRQMNVSHLQLRKASLMFNCSLPPFDCCCCLLPGSRTLRSYYSITL